MQNSAFCHFSLPLCFSHFLCVTQHQHITPMCYKNVNLPNCRHFIILMFNGHCEIIGAWRTVIAFLHFLAHVFYILFTSPQPQAISLLSCTTCKILMRASNLDGAHLRQVVSRNQILGLSILVSFSLLMDYFKCQPKKQIKKKQKRRRVFTIQSLYLRQRGNCSLLP